MLEDNKHIIRGSPPLKPIPTISLGKLIYDKLQSESLEDSALVDFVDGKSISYKDLLIKSCCVAKNLRQLGLGKSSVITICSENCTEFFIPVVAALYIGAIIAPINHNYTKSEMLHALNLSKPTIIFCSREVADKIKKIKKEVPFVSRIILINSDERSNSVHSIYKFYSNEIFDPSAFEVTEVKAQDQVGFIMCSSGTTGLPKGVMLTHHNILTMFTLTEDPYLFNQQKQRCTLGVLPFFHAYGMFRGLLNILKKIEIIVLKRFEEEQFLSAIEKYKITSLSLVPPLAIFLARSPLVSKYNLSSIIELSCGAAPLSKNTEELLKSRLNIKCVQQAYGLTEVTLRVLGLPFGLQKFGSSGKVMPYMLCKVRDPETGKSLGPNQVGELCFKGPLVMKGYCNNEEATKNSFTNDGWLLSGDLGYYDNEEFFYIVDRLKELIKYNAFQVPPAELEALLITNPKIKDAGVVGVPDEDAGELPLAFVVPNPGVNLTEDEVKQFVEERVSSPKKLRGGVIFIAEIPKNPSGKILRRKLRELLKKQKSKL